MRPHRYGGAWRAGVSYFAPLGDLAYLGFRRVARSQGNESKDEQSGWRCSAMKTTSEMPSGTASPPLAEILDAHAKMETEVGEIYVCFALSFSHIPDLRQMWTTMALEEGGHAGLARVAQKGLLSGMLRAKSLILPVKYIDSLGAQLAAYHREAREPISLDRALRVTWEMECSELDFMRELLVSSSNLDALGFPTNVEDRDSHLGRLRELIQRHATDEKLRREVIVTQSGCL
jgi:hypothetical protein